MSEKLTERNVSLILCDDPSPEKNDRWKGLIVKAIPMESNTVVMPNLIVGSKS